MGLLVPETSLSEEVLDDLLATYENVEAGTGLVLGESKSKDLWILYEDLQSKKMTNLLKNMALKTNSAEMRAKCLILMFRNGLMRACPYTMLQASSLAVKLEVDLSREVSYLCKQPEALSEIIAPTKEEENTEILVLEKEICQTNA